MKTLNLSVVDDWRDTLPFASSTLEHMTDVYTLLSDHYALEVYSREGYRYAWTAIYDQTIYTWAHKMNQ